MGGAIGRLTRFDPPGRNFPAPCIGDEAVAPEQKHTSAGDMNHDSGGLARHPHDVVFESPAPWNLHISQNESNPRAVIGHPFAVDDPFHQATLGLGPQDIVPLDCQVDNPQDIVPAAPGGSLQEIVPSWGAQRRSRWMGKAPS